MLPKFPALIALLAAISVVSASGASFSNLVVFGDSLSDGGNASLYSGGASPGANYGTYDYSGWSFGSASLTTVRFTDGPNTTPVAAGPAGIWVDQLAGKLGIRDPFPSAIIGGSNYAIGSAQTGTGVGDIGSQVAAYVNVLNGGPTPPNQLFIFWGGANDIFNLNSPTGAADNISGYISSLHSLGATDFLWLNLPLLGETPAGKPLEFLANQASAAFNAEWTKDLTALQASGIQVTGVDISSLFSDIVANPNAFGFTNISDPAQGASLPNDAGYLFWDGVHPTTQGHALVADAVFNALTVSPEPTSISLALVGLGLGAGILIRKGRRQ